MITTTTREPEGIAANNLRAARDMFAQARKLARCATEARALFPDDRFAISLWRTSSVRALHTARRFLARSRGGR